MWLWHPKDLQLPVPMTQNDQLDMVIVVQIVGDHGIWLIYSLE